MGEFTCAIEVQSINLPERHSAVLNILCGQNFPIGVDGAAGLEPCLFEHALLNPKVDLELYHAAQVVCVADRVGLCVFNVILVR